MSETVPRTQRHAYIIEDDPALRRIVVRMLSDAGMTTAEFGSAEAFLDGYPDRPTGCVLIDVRLPGMDGLELLERLSALAPRSPVVMISGFGDIPSAVRAVKMGALDFLQKPFGKDRLLEVVEKAFERIDDSARNDQDFERLTPREREVLVAFQEGDANKVVAARLGLSPRTVEMHRARLFRKLGVTNLAQALMRARDAGLIGQGGSPADD